MGFWAILRHLLPAFALLASVFPSGAQDTGIVQTFTVRRPVRPHRDIASADSQLPHYDPLKFRVIELPPPDPQLIRNAREKNAREQFRRVTVGIHRPVSLATGDGTWEREQGGWRWRMAIKSETALAIRLHLAQVALPGGAHLYVYSPDSAQPVETFAAGAHGSFWSQILAGDTALLELALADTSDSPPQISLQVSEVSHMFERLGGFGTPSACEVDASCYQGWSAVGDAVALIYGSWSETFVCSGSLINNLAHDYSPMFLTAKHCFSDTYTAHSAVVYWRYKTNSCNGTAPDTSVVPQTNGAELLSMSDAADATLLLLTGNVPSDLPFLGWTTTDPGIGGVVTVLHHPKASFRRLAQGTRAPDVGGYPNHFAFWWATGIVEPGSSGSPGFNTNQQVIGQVSRGSSSCGTSTGPDLLGKFSVAYPDLDRTGDADLLTSGLHDDAYAPNSTQDSAATLPVPFPKTKLAIVGVGRPDWFNLSLPPNTKVSIAAESASTMNIAGTNVSLYPNGGYLGSVNPPYLYRSGSSPETLTFAVGTNGGAYTTYDLTVDVAPTAMPSLSDIMVVFPLPNSASVQATVSTGGLPTTSSAEYSTDPNFSTYATTASATTSPQHGFLYTWTTDSGGISAFLSPLQPETTYYVRVVATNDHGTVRSAPVSFTTPTMNVSANWSPYRVDFPSTVVGTPALTWHVGLWNNGNVFFKPETVTITPPFTVSYDPAMTCTFYVTCEFAVGFTPPSEGTFTGSLTVASMGKSWTLPLTGSGSNTPVLRMMMQQNFTYSTWAGQSATAQALLWNDGIMPLTISGISISPPFSASTDCPQWMQQGQICNLTIKFSPVSAGYFSTNVILYNNGATPNYSFMQFAQARDINLSLSRQPRPSRSTSPSAPATTPAPLFLPLSPTHRAPLLPFVFTVPAPEPCDDGAKDSCPPPGHSRVP